MKIPATPLSYQQITEKLGQPDFAAAMLRAMFAEESSPGKTAPPAPPYPHWEKVQHMPTPPGITAEVRWAAIKMNRSQTRRFIPLVDGRGQPFSYTMPDAALEMLHNIDQGASGRIATPDSLVNPQTKNLYLQSSLIEEAITSSQLEGAATTRAQAKSMLRAGRAPMDRAERMILNNYRAMQLVGAHQEKKMTPALVKKIHRVMVEKITPQRAAVPRLRTAGDKIGVWDDRDNTLLHQPPPASQLRLRMQALCDFANHGRDGRFMHPVAAAIFLHFWLAYDHPFTDGNGRTARALFYWSMLRQDYWLVEFISISSILRAAPAAYSRSFLHTETDDNDLTYFLLAQLQVVQRAIAQLHRYIARKTRQTRAAEQLMHAAAAFNHRQTALLSHALRHAGFRYTIESHGRSHAVAYQTARADLLSLAEQGLLIQARAGRRFSFAAPPDIDQRLQALP